MFKVEDIKAGYLLVVKKGVDDPFNMTVVPNDSGALGCVCPGKEWFPVDYLDEDLSYAGMQVTEVYGGTSNMMLLSNSTAQREVLWVYNPVVPMTHEEIEEALGHPFKYVCDEESEPEPDPSESHGVTRAWKVYGCGGRPQDEAFEKSAVYDFSCKDDGIRIIRVNNRDVTGTADYALVVITRNTSEECYEEFIGQITDGIFENYSVGYSEEVELSEKRG